MALAAILGLVVQYLWRAVDHDGDVIDILVQPRRDRDAAARFFRKLLKGQGRPPRRVITDKLRSYAADHRRVMPSVVHSTTQYENNRAELSHQPTRQRERQLRRFKSAARATPENGQHRCSVETANAGPRMGKYSGCFDHCTCWRLSSQKMYVR